MIDLEIAKKKVIEELNKKYKVEGDQIVVIDEYIITNDYGWAFSYQSQLALEGSFRHNLVGNFPIFVSKTDGSIHYIPRGMSIEKLVEELARSPIL